MALAIELEFINVIIPIAKIHEKYPGGWDFCLEELRHRIGRTVYFDGHLFRDGAMNPYDAEQIVRHWERRGLQPTANVGERTVWMDCCVAEMGHTTLPCDWLCFTENKRAAYLKGTVIGDIINCDKMSSYSV